MTGVTSEHPSPAAVDSGPVAVAGASGYVGRLLTARLRADGHSVIAFARHARTLPTGSGVRAISVDVGDVAAATRALAGVGTAYYLVHALAEGRGFESRDRLLARSFGEAAGNAGVQRIVYLGGLGHDALSPHLASRQEVGDVLRESGVPVVELRAAVILGAGSVSFEMLRFLTERLPVMVCPRWVATRLQPLAECDLLDYLAEAMTVDQGVYEVGTPDVTTYGEMMRAYARVRGLRPRKVLTIPLLTPSLSAHWVDIVSPVDRKISHSLIESLVSEVVVHDSASTLAAFSVRPMTVENAIRRALDDEAQRVSEGLFDRPAGLSGGVYTMRSDAVLRSVDVDAARRNLTQIGGDYRWYGMAWGWRLRVAIGYLLGERLQLTKPTRLQAGARVDWWTAERVDRDHLGLRSRGWRVGEGWLGYRVATTPARLEQVAALRPKGLLGFAYWCVIVPPIHRLILRRMARDQAHRIMGSLTPSTPRSVDPLAPAGRGV